MPSATEAWLQRVRYTAAEPTSWLAHARTLRQAAEDLWVTGNAHARNPGAELGTTVLASWKDPNFIPPDTGGSTGDVCFMLFGFALENLAKGIIVCRDSSLVKQAKLKRWNGKGHDLLALFVQAQIALEPDERETLERTSRLAEWKGRYPVAMNFYDVDARDPIIGHVAVTNIWPADEYARLNNVYESAKVALMEAMKAIPPLPADHNFG